MRRKKLQLESDEVRGLEREARLEFEREKNDVQHDLDARETAKEQDMRF